MYKDATYSSDRSVVYPCKSLIVARSPCSRIRIDISKIDLSAGSDMQCNQGASGCPKSSNSCEVTSSNVTTEHSDSSSSSGNEDSDDPDPAPCIPSSEQDLLSVSTPSSFQNTPCRYNSSQQLTYTEKLLEKQFPDGAILVFTRDLAALMNRTPQYIRKMLMENKLPEGLPYPKKLNGQNVWHIDNVLNFLNTFFVEEEA